MVFQIQSRWSFGIPTKIGSKLFQSTLFQLVFQMKSRRSFGSPTKIGSNFQIMLLPNGQFDLGTLKIFSENVAVSAARATGKCNTSLKIPSFVQYPKI